MRRLAGRLRPRARQVRATVEAIVDTVIRHEFGGTALFREDALDWTVEVMVGRIELMPSFLSLGMVALTALFDRLAQARTGRRFHALPADRRAALFDGWRRGPVSFMRDFTDFYTKMGIFVYCARIEELAAEEAAAVPLRRRARVRGVS